MKLYHIKAVKKSENISDTLYHIKTLNYKSLMIEQIELQQTKVLKYSITLTN